MFSSRRKFTHKIKKKQRLSASYFCLPPHERTTSTKSFDFIIHRVDGANLKKNNVLCQLTSKKSAAAHWMIEPSNPPSKKEENSFGECASKEQQQRLFWFRSSSSTADEYGYGRIRSIRGAQPSILASPNSSARPPSLF